MYYNISHLKSVTSVSYIKIEDLIKDEFKLDSYLVIDILLVKTSYQEYEGKSIFTIDNRKITGYENIIVQGLLKNNKKLAILQDYGDDWRELENLSYIRQYFGFEEDDDTELQYSIAISEDNKLYMVCANIEETTCHLFELLNLPEDSFNKLYNYENLGGVKRPYCIKNFKLNILLLGEIDLNFLKIT
jgi:hypothetical protein